MAAISAAYVTAGGQTSVIMTDLFQGLMLLVTGLLLLWLGIEHLGGPGQFWAHLPRGWPSPAGTRPPNRRTRARGEPG